MLPLSAAMAPAVLPMDPQTVSSRSEQIGSAIQRTAARFVRTWGFSTVEMVAAKFRILARPSLPRETLARRVLAELPDIEWLDPTREWFTLLDRASPMRAAIEKIVAVAGVIERDELEEALGKRRAFADAPPSVVRAYVEALKARVSRSGDARAALTHEEHVVLEAFERAGGAATLTDLRDATRGRLLPDALARVLAASPLFLRSSRGAYRLVGSFPIPRYVTLAGSTTIVAPIQ
jgi:hypothetical protein